MNASKNQDDVKRFYYNLEIVVIRQDRIVQTFSKNVITTKQMFMSMGNEAFRETVSIVRIQLERETLLLSAFDPTLQVLFRSPKEGVGILLSQTALVVLKVAQHSHSSAHASVSVSPEPVVVSVHDRVKFRDGAITDPLMYDL